MNSKVNNESVLDEAHLLGNEEKLALAKKHLKDMERSLTIMQNDQQTAYEAFREGMSDRETYLV